jgi:molybdate transport system substrate-binding protein
MGFQRQTRTFAGVAILAVAFLLAAGSVPGGAVAPGLPDVNVFAAASLTEAFTVLGKVLEERNPQVRVKFTFGGSQRLATQIEQGAQADVFASADPRWMTHLQQRGLLAGTPREFARNRLVIIVPLTNPGRITQLQDLARPGVKFVMAADAVPAGHYMRAVLAKLNQAPGFGREYASNVLRNVVSEEDDVKAVVTKVQLGEADAGAVYRSDVTNVVSGRVQILPIPDQYNVVANYPIAIVKGGQSPTGASQFVGLVLSFLGQQMLLGYNFIPVNLP